MYDQRILFHFDCVWKIVFQSKVLLWLAAGACVLCLFLFFLIRFTVAKFNFLFAFIRWTAQSIYLLVSLFVNFKCFMPCNWCDILSFWRIGRFFFSIQFYFFFYFDFRCVTVVCLLFCECFALRYNKINPSQLLIEILCDLLTTRLRICLLWKIVWAFQFLHFYTSMSNKKKMRTFSFSLVCDLLTNLRLSNSVSMKHVFFLWDKKHTHIYAHTHC